jgi:hypothetical protein
MKRLPIKMKRIIKEERFSLNNTNNERDWRGGMKIDYRITMVKSCEEKYYDNLTPMNNDWGRILVNLKVKGQVQLRHRWEGDKVLTEIGKACKVTKNYWGGYDSNYDSLWGSEIHKRIRKEIRSKVQNEVRNYLRIFGIKTKGWDGGIQINKISFEK